MTTDSHDIYDIPHPFEGDLKFLLVMAMLAAGLSAVGLALVLIRIFL